VSGFYNASSGDNRLGTPDGNRNYPDSQLPSAEENSPEEGHFKI
jgi:hypothetical protein